ncbi:stage V sporulation protein AE [Selenihalanaerobacter shriftii]|uniref:Stage V sporulation protein AE n=1 Tax=Selenihalanaerobacter shriftii TaxID=142842 RepID=A0A1T4M5X9_9FIRM|nr:stage V sporulation protein AE [Selenihalanaerobacter shriftii]SJZ62383.1 stage V sporulation protein AE [Selenihalanaerobacter shriftii]
MSKKNVIVVTDGDETACEAVETVGKKLGLRTISKSSGNPTTMSGKRIVDLIKEAKSDTVLVMFDDQGNKNKGPGEEAMEIVLASDEIKILGILAVASGTKEVEGIKPDFSVDNNAKIVEGPVDKEGNSEIKGHLYLEGDTVDVINKFKPPLLVGIGDIGKMNKEDKVGKGSPITTKAIEEILSRSGVSYERDI